MADTQIASLDRLTTAFAKEMPEVNQIILARMGSDVPLIPQLAGHLIAAGGKRLRPLLTLAGASLAMTQNEIEKMPAAAHYLSAAVEFIHNATLLHDDVIDNSDQRRGKQTANALWGNEASVLVGDFLFARAFELMVETGDIQILQLLASASAQITEGEVKQMTVQNAPDSTIDDYLSVITGKTAILFAAAAHAGARTAQADQPLCDGLHEYGLALGRAFQICDDALDYLSDAGTMGKNAGDDFYEGKITLPVIFAYQGGSPEERRFFDRTMGNSEIEDGDFEQAKQIFDRHHAIERALDMADGYVEQAITALQCAPECEMRIALIEAARYAARRPS